MRFVNSAQDSYYGILNMGPRQSMDTAWGRRIYDQYEIELSHEKAPKGSVVAAQSAEQQQGNKNKRANGNGGFSAPSSSGGRNNDPRELGVWDLVFNPDVIPTLKVVYFNN